MLDPSRSRIVLSELPLGLPHRGAVVVEDYRPARRGPLVYRQYIISCHNAFSFRYRPQSSQPSSVSFTTRATSYPGVPRTCAAETFPSSDYAPLRTLSISSVTEPNTRVKDLSHRQLVITYRHLSAGEKNTARSGQITLPRKRRKFLGDNRRHAPPGNPYRRRAYVFPGPLHICNGPELLRPGPTA